MPTDTGIILKQVSQLLFQKNELKLVVMGMNLVNCVMLLSLRDMGRLH